MAATSRINQIRRDPIIDRYITALEAKIAKLEAKLSKQEAKAPKPKD